MDFKKLEKKWQKKWNFESDTNKDKKFFTSIVIPYVNGSLHIGHSYTFTRTDVYARFKRMKGFNVLLAQGFHATGEPIVGVVERLRKSDRVQINTLKKFGLDENEIRKFKKLGPEYVAKFWAEKIEEDSKMMGFSVDWRRKFITAVDPHFNRFIEWQYLTLKEKGYVVQGTHPVIWCPHDKSPTGDHDRLEGEGVSPQDYILLKFKLGDSFLVTATLRPETVHGVTNIWVNEHAEYVKAKVDEEKWIISKETVEKLQDQLKDVKILDTMLGHVLLGKLAKNPLTNIDVPILPADFVDPDNGSGIVMSVPSHAPYDWMAIKDLIASNQLEKFGVTKDQLEPINVIKSELPENPAVDLCNKLNIQTQKDPKLEEVTSILYKKEFHSGVISVGEYTGLKVSDCKEKLILDFMQKGFADVVWDCDNVVCRCMTKCHVKILENQWFLKYSDENWKKQALECLNSMAIYPIEARNNFISTIDWLKDKACTRKSGLGTKLPWDKDWIIETLSDSTIYMAYYTISHLIKKVKPEYLTKDVFDFIFLNKKAPKSKIPLKLLNQMKDEFEYYYPLDFRNSAKDLIQNHLTFFIFQHVALFSKKYWPKCISVNGYVNVEGEKMSKSKGNFLPLKDLVDTHGADLVRINIAASNEGIDDADWRTENINSYRGKLEYLFSMIPELKKAKSSKSGNAELYLQSKINSIVQETEKAMEETKFRTAVNHSLFETTNAIKWYLKRVNGIQNANRLILKETLETTVKLLAPITPHFSEECFSNLSKGLVAFASYPNVDKKKINKSIEEAEESLHLLIKDIDEIKILAKKEKPNSVQIFVAEQWKYDVYNYILKNKSKPMNDITKEIMSTGKYSNSTIGFIQNVYKKINEIKPIVDRKLTLSTLQESKPFLEKEISCSIQIVESENSNHPKARSSSPNKVGIFVE